MRADKNKVQDMLFQAFTEHQYYNIKDLEKKTGQPTVKKFFVSFYFERLYV